MSNAIAKPAWPLLQRWHPLTQGLVGAWPFYEGTGGKVNDLSGYGHNGTLQNSPSWSGGLFGSVLSFNGSTQYITAGDAANVTGPGITVAAWIKFTASQTNAAIVARWNSSGQYLLLVDISTANAITFYVHPSVGVNHAKSNNSSYNDGKWHFIAGRYDGVNVTISVDLTDVVSTAATGNIQTEATTFTIGAYSDTTGKFNGSIDHVRVYNRALSAAELRQLYFDPFVIYRPESRWWETAPTGGAFTNRPGPRMGPALPFGLAIGGAYSAIDLLKRNPIVRRRKLVRWWE